MELGLSASLLSCGQSPLPHSGMGLSTIAATCTAKDLVSVPRNTRWIPRIGYFEMGCFLRANRLRIVILLGRMPLQTFSAPPHSGWSDIQIASSKRGFPDFEHNDHKKGGAWNESAHGFWHGQHKVCRPAWCSACFEAAASDASPNSKMLSEIMLAP